jgi:hypothetical protein
MKTPLLASLQLQSTARDQTGVFIRIHSAVVLAAAADWNESTVQSALTDFIRPGLTAARLGVAWQPKSGFNQLDGLWPLAASVRGKYLLISDDPALLGSLLANFTRKSVRPPADLLAGFNHQREHGNFVRFTGLIDRPNALSDNQQNPNSEPQFFSGNMASLSSALAAVSSEKIEVRSEGPKVRQSVTYEWSQ